MRVRSIRALLYQFSVVCMSYRLSYSTSMLYGLIDIMSYSLFQPEQIIPQYDIGSQCDNLNVRGHSYV